MPTLPIDKYLIGVEPGALDRLKDRIERRGGVVHDLQNFSGTMKVSGMSRRDLLSLPGVRYVQGDGTV